MHIEKSRFINICDRLIGWSFYVLMAGITFSNSFTEAATAIIIILTVLKRTADGNYRLTIGISGLLLSAFVSWSLISIINTLYINESIRGFLKVAKHALLFIAAVDYFNSRKKIERFLLFSIGVSFVIILNSIIQYITGIDIIRQRQIDPLDYLHRVSSSFRHANDYGAYLVVILSILMSLFFSRKRAMKSKALLLVIIISGLWSLFATGSRGAWLGFLAAFIFLAMLKSKKLLAVILVLLLSLAISSPRLLKNRFSDFLSIKTGGTTWERIKLWSGTLNMVKEHPLIGFGINTYTRNFPKYKPPDYPDVRYTHNSFLQMAAETGIIGAGLFLLFLTALIISAVKAIRFFDKGLSRDLFIGITAGTTGFLAHCTVDTHLYSVTLSAFLFLCLGIIVAFSKLTHEKPAV